MKPLLTDAWLDRQARVCYKNYRGYDDPSVRSPLLAADLATSEVSDVIHRMRFAVRNSLGLDPMVDCFRFDVDGY